jgi:hypothetical protein
LSYLEKCTIRITSPFGVYCILKEHDDERGELVGYLKEFGNELTIHSGW